MCTVLEIGEPEHEAEEERLDRDGSQDGETDPAIVAFHLIENAGTDGIRRAGGHGGVRLERQASYRVIVFQMKAAMPMASITTMA